MADFQSSGLSSIDEFLQHHKDENSKQKQFGYLCIKFIIESCLNKAAFEKNDWIEKYVQYFMGNEKRRNAFLKNPPKVISFNYDSFFKAKVEYLIRQVYLQKQFEHKNIFYVYGNVSGTFLKYRPHEIDRNIFNECFALPNQISLIRYDSKSVKKLSEQVQKDIVDSSKFKILLGYGFNSFNNSILFRSEAKLKKIAASKKLLSTSLKLDKQIKKKMSELKIFQADEQSADDLIDGLIPRTLFFS